MGLFIHQQSGPLYGFRHSFDSSGKSYAEHYVYVESELLLNPGLELLGSHNQTKEQIPFISVRDNVWFS